VEAFEKAGIVIPFPQRDVHLKSGEVSAKSDKK
jgi:small-conductance mechanosensitive channel